MRKRMLFDSAFIYPVGRPVSGGGTDIKSERDFLILTNNPLVFTCMSDRFRIVFSPELTYREILVKARDLVYIGHTLYTHPLSGSVKPNETPYKSVVVSRVPHVFSPEQAEKAVSEFLGHHRRDVTRIYLASLKEADNHE